MASNQSYKSQNYFILTPSETKNITNFHVSKSFEFQTDHRLICCELEEPNWRYFPPRNTITNKINCSNKNDYKQELENLLTQISTDLTDDTKMNRWIEGLTNYMKKAAGIIKKEHYKKSFLTDFITEVIKKQ